MDLNNTNNNTENKIKNITKIVMNENKNLENENILEDLIYFLGITFSRRWWAFTCHGGPGACGSMVVTHFWWFGCPKSLKNSCEG